MKEGKATKRFWAKAEDLRKRSKDLRTRAKLLCKYVNKSICFAAGPAARRMGAINVLVCAYERTYAHTRCSLSGCMKSGVYTKLWVVCVIWQQFCSFGFEFFVFFSGFSNLWLTVILLPVCLCALFALTLVQHTYMFNVIISHTITGNKIVNEGWNETQSSVGKLTNCGQWMNMCLLTVTK